MGARYWVEGLLLTITLLLPFVLIAAIMVTSLLKQIQKKQPALLPEGLSRFMPAENYVAYLRRVGWPAGLGLWFGVISCWLYVAFCWVHYHSIPAGTTVTERFGFGIIGAIMPCVFIWLPLSVVDIVRARRTGWLGMIVGICGVLLNLSSFALLWSAEQMTMDYYSHIHHIRYRLED